MFMFSHEQLRSVAWIIELFWEYPLWYRPHFGIIISSCYLFLCCYQ
uniref:Uncharacterized protein n=1 Tax=Rhizophora mucronata TaxID=61149 RepID=A0A2P2NDW7_RHIMU